MKSHKEPRFGLSFYEAFLYAELCYKDKLMSLGYKTLSSAEPFWHGFFSEASSKVLAVRVCDLMRTASVVTELLQSDVGFWYFFSLL